MMKKRIFSAFMAGFSAAMFGVLYPEYILLPDTYQYIAEVDELLQEQTEEFSEKELLTDISELLYAKPEEIEVSSKLMQFLTDKIQENK